MDLETVILEIRLDPHMFYDPHALTEHVPKGFSMISIFDRDMAIQSSGRTDRQLRNRWTLGVPK